MSPPFYVEGQACVSGVGTKRLSPDSSSRNQELRVRLAEKSLEELTAILSSYKTLHNSTDVDRQTGNRAIEIEEYYAKTPIEEREFPQLNSLIIGVDIDRELRQEKITRRLKQKTGRRDG